MRDIWLILLVWAFSVLIITGIVDGKFLYASRDPFWDEYAETQEWHEIGGLDRRYQDPCGPGVHEGKLGEPGCLE
jgi:hypothetical protein